MTTKKTHTHTHIIFIKKNLLQVASPTNMKGGWEVPVDAQCKQQAMKQQGG